MSQATFLAALAGPALAWFILFLIALAVLLWFISWLFFPAEDPVSVSQTLKNLTGLDDRMAARLVPYGIRSDRDLMRLTPRGQQELQSQLDLHNGEYDQWRREILARWRNQYLPSAFRDLQAITPNPELGGVYTKRPREFDDLTKLSGIDKVTASRLHNAGIYTYEQFRLMMPEQQACVKRKFNLTGFDFDALPDYGVTAQWLAFLEDGKASKTAANTIASNIVPASVTASAATAISASPSSSPDDSNIVASSFASSQAIESASQDNDSLETQPSNGPSVAPSVGSEQQKIPTTRIDAELGRLYSGPPPHRDDLTKLNGIDREKAASLNAAGIYTIDQVKSLSLSQRNSFRRRFDLPHFDFSRSTSTTPSSGSGVPKPHFEVDPQAIRDGVSSLADLSEHPNLGFVYLAKPQKTDDLTQIEGITSSIAKQLNAAGIYTFDQIESMTETQQANFRSRFGLPDFKFIPGELGSFQRRDASQPAKPQYTSNDASSTLEKTVVGFAASGEQARLDNAPTIANALAAGGDVSPQTSSHGSATDSPLGFTYSSRPQNADKLDRLPDIDPAMAQRLNDAGIYTFDQLNSLTLPQQTQLRTRFGLEHVNFAEWQRLIFAWSRGVDTSLEAGSNRGRSGWLHSVRLPTMAPGVFDGQQLVAYPEQTIFRGTAPVHWGTTVSVAKEGVARSVAAADIRTDINYVRIRRLDTRESVVTRVTKSQLFSPGTGTDGGWSGLCERFLGARHLGVFASQIPTEVEIEYGSGGWGFGHQFDAGEGQEFCWGGRMIPPTTFEISVGRIGPATGTVVFRSNDPAIWNSHVSRSQDDWAATIESVPHPISFVRVVHTDSGQGVIVKTDRVNVTRRGENPHVGWNGLNDHFYGGYHLGVYLQSAPQDVEIAYGEGGWGFGHPYDDNDRQAYGLAGRAISKTVFEISLLEHLPDHLRTELVG